MWQFLAQANDSAPSILERFGPVFVPAGVILAAIIAGSFTIRNARKTPHEQLKTLVEIREKLHVVDTHVIDAAIDRELEKIDRLHSARTRGVWSGLNEAVKQALEITYGRGLFGAVVAGLAQLLYQAAIAFNRLLLTFVRLMLGDSQAARRFIQAQQLPNATTTKRPAPQNEPVLSVVAEEPPGDGYCGGGREYEQ